MAFDLSDILEALGNSYLETKKLKTDDPLELFFTGFINGKRRVDELIKKDNIEYNKQRKYKNKKVNEK
jgi:hypothetical protein